ncbi:MAG TPA: hypothetical protein VIH76_09555 [Candidatus Acidoferrales bacterium]
MNCVQFQEIVHDLARDAGLDQPARRDALAHADSCPRCDELLSESQTLTAALRSLAAKDGALGASERVEEALIGAFRQQHSAAAHSNRPWQWGLASVAGLAALVLLSVLVLRHPVVSPPTHGNGASATPSGAAVAPESAASSQQPDASVESAANANSNFSDADTEYASAFVALPFNGETAPVGDEVVVRESLSPAALANLGLPVSEANAGENVLADFVVDEDGTPRAVRLVE